MKAFFRSAFVQQVLATLFAAWLRLCYATFRWTRVDQEKVEAVWAMDSGAVLCFWHAQVPLAPQCWPQSPHRQDMRCLISRSSDGEFIALTMERNGFPAFRGSSKKMTDPNKNKYGEQALRDMARWVRAGGAVALTPDGPRGPAEVMQGGALSLARITGAPVIFCGLAVRPSFRIGSWDRTHIPLPFARGVMVWDGPHFIAKGDDIDALRPVWEARLTGAQRRAEALVDGRGVE